MDEASRSLLFARCLGGNRTIDQLDECHRGIVTGAIAALQDAQVTARTGGVARAELIEELADRFLGARARERQTAVRNGVLLGQGDQRLDMTTQFLGFRQGSLDDFVLEPTGLP